MLPKGNRYFLFLCSVLCVKRAAKKLHLHNDERVVEEVVLGQGLDPAGVERKERDLVAAQHQPPTLLL